jgi:hypothetical protein
MAILLFTLSVPVSAQQSGPPPGAGPPADRRNADRLRQQDMSNREWQLRNFGKEPKATTDHRKIQALGEQIEQDFNRVLTLHNEIVRAISSGQRLDFEFVADATEEIKKRATRLQSTLALEQQEKVDTPAAAIGPDHDKIKAALTTLCKEIKSFVTNPVIEKPGTVSADELARARNDLDAIIKLSDQIRKDSKKLDNTQH